MTAICNIIAVLIVFGAIYLSIKTKILKDVCVIDSDIGPVETYSFARTQGLWWTTLIGACFVIGFGKRGEVIELNSTCLVLLAIGVGTTAVASVIDNNTPPEETPKDKIETEKDLPPKLRKPTNFFTQILSDSTGITVYRYQALIFNLIFSMVFLVTFFEKLSHGDREFPSFSSETLGLMGISATTYLGMKATEK